MVHLKTIFDTRRQKSDGTYPITFRITHVKKVYYIPSGISIKKDDWVEDTRTVRKSHPNAQMINTGLSEQYFKIQKAILTIEQTDSFSFEKLKAVISPSLEAGSAKTYYEFSQELIETLRKQKKNGNAIVYNTAINRLVKFIGKEKLLFDDINYSLLVNFNNKLLEDGVRLNSISNYFRALRAIYNKGIKEKLVDRSTSPFFDFSIKTEKTKKRAISKASIQILKATPFRKDTAEWHAVNYFLLSFYLIGISFTDLAYLKLEDIQESRLIFKRRKTHKWYNIKLFEAATEIIFYYHIPGNTFLLPILPNNIEEDTEECKRIISQWIKTTNKYLKRIGVGNGLEIVLTTYVSRHAWATIAKKLGYSNDLIAEALGHSFGNRVTDIYLADFDKEMIDEMHCKVIQI